MRCFRRSRAGLGFSLIEVLVAISVFAIITVGLVPLLATSLRGSMVSRSFTQAKTLVQRSLETARGLPYFVTGSTRTDVLDMYYPNLVTGATVTTAEAGSVVSGYSSSEKTYTTVCTVTTKAPAASAPAACPHNLPNGASTVPAGTTLVFKTQFLDRNLAAYAPVAGYTYSSATTAPSSLLKATVTAYWKTGGNKRNFSMTTLMGARKLNTETIHGEGKINYMVQVLTGYQDADGGQSSLNAAIGASDSQVSTKAISTADQSVVTGNATLTEGDFGDTQGAAIGSIEGASKSAGAPPNAWPGTAVTDLGSTLGPGLPGGLFTTPLSIAALSANQVDYAGVQVNNDLPQAQGSLRFNNLGNDSFWVTNQVNPATYMQLDPTQPMVEVDKGSSTRSAGSTTASSTALTPASGRKVETTATADVNKISILPTGFICNGSSNPSCSGGDRSVLVVSGFRAALDCKATASTTYAAAAAGSWSATVKYWDAAQGAYVTVPGVGGSTTSTGADPLAALKTGNPLVFDSPIDSQDVHLFAINGVKGFLKDMSSEVHVASTTDATGVARSVSLDGAISVVTAPTDPAWTAPDPQTNPTGINVTVGSMSCLARDNRG